MRIRISGIILGVALRASAGIPTDAPPADNADNGAGLGIFVPDPIGGRAAPDHPAAGDGDEPGNAPGPDIDVVIRTGLSAEPAPVRIHDPVPGGRRAGVDPEDHHGRSLRAGPVA